MSTSTFQHRPPAIRNLGERIFARGFGRASRFLTDAATESVYTTLTPRDVGVDARG